MYKLCLTQKPVRNGAWQNWPGLLSGNSLFFAWSLAVLLWILLDTMSNLPVVLKP